MNSTNTPLATFTVPGRVVVKKNSRPIWRLPNGRSKLGKSKRLQAYEEQAIARLRAAWAGKAPLTGQLWVECHAYQHDARWEPDLLGWQETLWDCLQAAGVIANDKLIESSDGSRKHLRRDGPDEATITIYRYA